jgi:transcriptional regulator with XRE-family HTH domain
MSEISRDRSHIVTGRRRGEEQRVVVHRVRDAAETTDPAGASSDADLEAQIADHPVGSRIRELRRANGLTLQQLAATSGVSVGYLSEIERDLTRLPIGVLGRLADVLGVHLHWFFHGDADAPEDERDIVVRSGHGRRLTFPGIGISDEMLSPNLLGPLEVIRSTLAPGADSGDYTHDGHEAGVILSGTFDLWVGARHLRLSPGDSFSFPSTERHRCANTTDVPVTVLWIVTPPHY